MFAVFPRPGHSLRLKINYCEINRLIKGAKLLIEVSAELREESWNIDERNVLIKRDAIPKSYVIDHFVNRQRLLCNRS